MYDDDVQRLLIRVGPGVFASAVDDVLRRLSSCDIASPRKVREMPARALLTSVVRVQQGVVACAGPLTSKASTILRAARVPSEACYRSAVAYVLRTWLGNPAVVTVEECNSGGAKRVHLRVDTGPRKIIIDIVCHRPAGSPDTGQSVAEHLVRVVEDYAPAHPGFEPWLVNFVTQEEEEVAEEEERQRQALRVRVRREDMPEEQEAEGDEGGFWTSGLSRSVANVRTAVPRLRRQRAGKWWMRRW